MKHIKKLFIIILYSILSCICLYILFYPIYFSSEIIIPFGLHPFDIYEKNSDIWTFLKSTFIFLSFFSNLIIFNFFINKYNFIIEKFISLLTLKSKKEKINHNFNPILENEQKIKLIIGKEINSQKNIIIPQSGLFQNFLITGTIGTGKTSSAMYPFTEQLIKYNFLNQKK